MTASMWITILLLALGLSMDAFAVSVTNGLCYRDISATKNAIASGLAFGLSQGLMPLLGYLLGSAFRGGMERIDHWVALVLLSLIGVQMIREALGKPDAKGAEMRTTFSPRTLAVQAVATSIDALAVGVSLAIYGANIFLSAAVIAIVTFCCCFAGVFIGRRFGGLLGDRALLLGGVILIFIGVRIFIDHIPHIF